MKFYVMIRCLIALFFLPAYAAPIIDVVIPCHEKDQRTLEQVIAGARKNVQNVRRIIVISKYHMTTSAEWFDEARYPFNRRSILTAIFNNDVPKAEAYATSRKNRTGWIYQQFLKLYAPFVIPDISENVLVLDADTVFIKPITFIDQTGAALYGMSSEYYPPYFEHMQRLLPGLKKVFKDYSGICHHMLFQRPVLEQLFQKISAQHGCEPWIAICRCIDHSQLYLSALSEYEIYFNYVFSSGFNVKTRYVCWTNVYSQKDLDLAKQQQFYDSVSFHNYSFEIE